MSRLAYLTWHIARHSSILLMLWYAVFGFYCPKTIFELAEQDKRLERYLPDTPRMLMIYSAVFHFALLFLISFFTFGIQDNQLTRFGLIAVGITQLTIYTGSCIGGFLLARKYNGYTITASILWGLFALVLPGIPLLILYKIGREKG